MWVMDMINAILIEVLGSIAENERLKIRRRQREGIDAAKKERHQVWAANAGTARKLGNRDAGC